MKVEVIKPREVSLEDLLKYADQDYVKKFKMMILQGTTFVQGGVLGIVSFIISLIK